ncbi:MAG: DinB family protein [Kiloniellales bacterium]
MNEAGLVEHYRAMARNNAWSNLRLHRACGRLSEAEYTAERTSFFPSIHLTLNHILIVDLLYLERLERKAEAYRDPGDELYGDLPGLTRAQGAADRRLIGFCAALRGPDLDAEVTLFRRDGVKIDRVGAVLPHLFVHQIHHRGQVHAMLAGSAVAPPQLDEFFLAEDAPLRRAELEALGLDSA